MAGTADVAEFEFRTGALAPEDVFVLDLWLEEELSRPFHARLELVAAEGMYLEPETLLGQEALVTIHREPSDRFLHGVVTAVERWDVGRDDPTRNRYVVHVGPALWRLSLQRRCRIFQDLTIPEIVTQVLREGGVEHQLALSSKYAPQGYRVQYRESDLDLVSRLLEEAGIFYRFEHGTGAHTMILTDRTSACPDLPDDPAIPYRAWKSVQDEHVDAFRVRKRIRPAVVTLRDYDYVRPNADMETTESAGAGTEVYDYPGGYGSFDEGRTIARLRLEGLQASGEVFSGSSVSRRLEPGTFFQLVDHPSGFDGEYLVLSVLHQGVQVEATGGAGDPKTPRYRNEFTCIRKGVPFRPERSTPRPTIPGAQTAVVVGPAGEEIHTDEHGRIKVQFHWDREGRKDERSSCWVRVSQAWAGPGWGALYLPRIGHEVVVEFLEGDPDRPLVTGSVYNGLNPPPVALPSEKTRSTLRSASSPGSNGANELRFEDAAGAEEIYLHAQKDLKIRVENDKAQEVGANESLQVGANRFRSVGGDQTLLVEQDDSSTIQENQSLEVGRDRSTSVGGNHLETVYGDQTIAVGQNASLTVGQSSTEAVGLAKTVTVGAAHSLTVGAAMTEVVGGSKSEEVGGAKSEQIGGKKTETIAGSRSQRVGGGLSESIGKSRTLKVGKDYVLTVGGSLQHSVSSGYTVKGKQITVVAEDDFTIRVGSAAVTVSKSGAVVIQGSNVKVQASGPVVLKGSSVSEN